MSGADIDIILEAPRRLRVRHSNALIAWARQERDYTELEAIDNALDGYIDDPVKTPRDHCIMRLGDRFALKAWGIDPHFAVFLRFRRHLPDFGRTYPAKAGSTSP